MAAGVGRAPVALAWAILLGRAGEGAPKDSDDYRCRIDLYELSIESLADFRRKYVGFIFQVMNLFRTLDAQGLTLVMVTHSMENARYAGRLIQIRNGLIVADQKGADYAEQLEEPRVASSSLKRSER